MKPVFYCLPYSPWSLKATFALRHHAVDVERKVYTPLLDAPELRLRLRKLGGKVTVPVLFADEGAITDSFEIALYADRVGRGAPLLLAERRESIAEWNACSERLLAAGRGRAMVRAARSLDAAYETLPKAVSKLPLLGPAIARGGLVWFNRKYAILERDQEQNESVIRSELERLRAALAGGREHLLDAFSYADVTMAMALQLLEPLPETAMGPAMRVAATETALCEQYADLLRWRDALHREHTLIARHESARAAA
ncbi:MAG TPA: glutathione S-transferase N-terminal domain-containing protein [Polyangiales bacterium]|nr:glutathione S-transferase N-terminal domain-containing protein [Polyangiales bacterium]